LFSENAGVPTNGAVITQTAGKIIWRDTWVGYGMANPSANGHNPVDQVSFENIIILKNCIIYYFQFRELLW
jgi:hypothetical protein